MEITAITPEIIEHINYILDQNSDLLGKDFAERTRRNMSPFIKQKTEGGMRDTSDENLKVAVVGAFSCGKSTFINSILGDQVAPVEITPKTHGVTSFIFGDEETYDADGMSITRAQYQEQVQDKENKVRHFIVHYPCERLKTLEFMDSPGFGSVSGNSESVAKKDTELSEEAVNRADVVFFLTNITEGVIQGDALERLKNICNQHENVVNPHRRIYVILTWADAKAPKERERIQQSIINLCAENKLPIESVLLYSSLDLEKLRSEQTRNYFSAARENLFRILLDLQKFRVELITYRQALQKHFDQLKTQQFIQSFTTDAKRIIESEREIQVHDIKKQLQSEWKSARDEIADVLYKVFQGKLETVKSRMIWHEDSQFLSTSKIEVFCQNGLACLTKDELDSIIKEIIKACNLNGYAISPDAPSLSTLFCAGETKKSPYKVTEDEEMYTYAYDGRYVKSEVEIFPKGSLRDYYFKICVMMTLKLGGPWCYRASNDKLRSISNNKLKELQNIYDSEALDHFKDLIDRGMKDALFTRKQDEQLQQINQKLDKIEYAIDNLDKPMDLQKRNNTNKQESLGEATMTAKSKTYKVIISKTGSRSLKLGKLIVQLVGGELENVLEAIEEPPYVVKEDASEEDANDMKAKFEELGASVEIKPNVSAEQPVSKNFKVVLTDAGSKPLKVGRLIVQLTGGNLEEVLDAIEEPPFVIKENVSEAEADDILAQFDELGASVDCILIAPDEQPITRSYKVVLMDAGPKPLKVGKMIVQLTDADLEQVLEAIDEPPYYVKNDITEEEANDIADQLRELGAEMEVQLYSTAFMLDDKNALNSLDKDDLIDAIMQYPETARNCTRWDEFDNYDWCRLIKEQPALAEFADKANAWEKLENYNWRELVSENPSFLKHFKKNKKEDFDALDWLEILKKQPQLFSECPATVRLPTDEDPYGKYFTFSNWLELLIEQPDLEDKMPWGEEPSVEEDYDENIEQWLRLIAAQPRFEGRLDWSRATNCNNGEIWKDLIKSNPKHAKVCPWSKFTPLDWWPIFKYCPQCFNECECPDKVPARAWAYLLCNRPELADKFDRWNEITVPEWASLLHYQPSLRYKCPCLEKVKKINVEDGLEEGLLTFPNGDELLDMMVDHDYQSVRLNSTLEGLDSAVEDLDRIINKLDKEQDPQ